MKRFVIQIIKFSSIVIVILFVSIALTLLIVSNASFSIPRDKHIVVAGDSYTEYAIDDSIFTPSVNISQSGTAYLYSYLRLKKILEDNAHIDTVLLSFHYSVLQTDTDDWVTDDKYILLHIPKHAFLIGKEEYNIFIKNSTFWTSLFQIPVKNIKPLLKFAITRNISYKDLNIGGYNKSERDKLQKDIEMQKNITVPSEPEDISFYQLHYLNKIITLCKEKNVKLFLLNTPTYKSAQYGKKDELLSYYNTYLQGVTYKDLSDFPLPEYGYGDIGHLNYKGAEIFSRYLNDNYHGLFE